MSDLQGKILQGLAGLVLLVGPGAGVWVWQTLSRPAPLTLVHVDQADLLKRVAVGLAREEGGKPSVQAETFQACVSSVAEQHRWIMTDRAGLWGPPGASGQLPDVTAVLEKACSPETRP